MGEKIRMADELVDSGRQSRNVLGEILERHGGLEERGNGLQDGPRTAPYVEPMEPLAR